MMFCTTFLSAPSEELNCEASGRGATMGGGGLSPGSCLSSLHCLVLPQDELYPSLSDPTARLSICSEDRACNLVDKVLVDISVTTCNARSSRCIWDNLRRRRSRSASPSPSKMPNSPCSKRVGGMSFIWGANWKLYNSIVKAGVVSHGLEMLTAGLGTVIVGFFGWGSFKGEAISK